MLEVQIIIGVLSTSFISGILGMGGGVILMALLSFILPIKTAMIIHGVTQLSSNAFRTYIHRKDIKSGIIVPYIIGALICLVVFQAIRFIPSKALVLFLLGVFPLISFIPKFVGVLDIQKKGRSLFCGAIVAISQFLAGASGGVLDIFFINSKLNRFEIISTKALTQSFAHLIKLIYYLSIMNFASDLKMFHWSLYPMIIGTAYLGTWSAKFILHKLPDTHFRRYSKGVLVLLGIVLIYKSFTI